jgi:hypothetical protein
MALKSDRNEIQTDISFFCDTALDRGVLVAHGATAASGAGGMDVGANVAAVSAASDAVPLWKNGRNIRKEREKEK